MAVLKSGARRILDFFLAWFICLQFTMFQTRWHVARHQGQGWLRMCASFLNAGPCTLPRQHNRANSCGGMGELALTLLAWEISSHYSSVRALAAESGKDAPPLPSSPTNTWSSWKSWPWGQRVVPAPHQLQHLYSGAWPLHFAWATQ